MTKDEIEVRVAELREIERRGDSEAAAAGAEMLWVETLRAIADGAADPAGLAAAALVSVDEELGDT